MTSKLYFPLNDTRYGFEIFSKHTEKINNNSVGLYPNAEFFIVLINNTSGNVAVSVNINDRLVGTYEVIQHSTYKLINHGELNQFFKFYSEYRDNKNNINFSELKLEWKPIITLYKYIDNPNIKEVIFIFENRTGCTFSIIAERVFRIPSDHVKQLVVWSTQLVRTHADSAIRPETLITCP